MRKCPFPYKRRGQFGKMLDYPTQAVCWPAQRNFRWIGPTPEFRVPEGVTKEAQELDIKRMEMRKV